MQLVPVMDLKAGQVVRAVAGRRGEYRPVESVLSSTADPASVAGGIAGLGATLVYVADLDALAGAPPDWRSLGAIAGEGLRLWLDAGAGSVARTRQIAESPWLSSALDGIVVALESTCAPADLDALRAAADESARAIFSLDLRGGSPMAPAAWHGRSPVDIAQLAFGAGFRRLIALDLVVVGMSQGPPVELVSELRAVAPWEMLATGGGVRGPADLDALSAAGCDAALVATAIHHGRVGRAEFERFGGGRTS